MTKRKYIRIALSADEEAALKVAIAEFEAETNVAISESLFVLSVLRKHIKP